MATSDDKIKLDAALEGVVAGNARVGVLKSAVQVGLRRFINFVPGTNITLNVTDDPTNEKVDVEVVAASGAVGTTSDESVVSAASATNYTPTGAHVEGHLAGIDAAIGTKQASSAKLTALAGLTWAADKLAVITGAATAALVSTTAYGLSLLAAADAAALRTLAVLGALAVKNTIDSSALLDNGVVTLAKIVDATATDKMLARTSSGSGDWEEYAFTDAAQSLVDDTTVAQMRGTLEVAVEQIDIVIESPTAKTYPLVEYAEYPFTINRLTHKTASGSIVGKIQIGGVDVTGLTALTFDSSQTQTNAAGANSVPLGGRVTLVCSSPSSPADLSLSLKITR
jgi:hypothetical protein